MSIGRDGEIRTRDPLNPIQVRYQAALRPDLRRAARTRSVPHRGPAEQRTNVGLRHRPSAFGAFRQRSQRQRGRQIATNASVRWRADDFRRRREFAADGRPTKANPVASSGAAGASGGGRSWSRGAGAASPPSRSSSDRMSSFSLPICARVSAGTAGLVGEASLASCARASSPAPGAGADGITSWATGAIFLPAPAQPWSSPPWLARPGPPPRRRTGRPGAGAARPRNAAARPTS